MKAESRPTRRRSPRAASTIAPRGEIVVLRVDYFENYAGRFLSVEAKDGSAARADGSTTRARRCRSRGTPGAGTPIDAGPRAMNVNIDPDTTPDTYIEHRELVRIGDPARSTPAAPTMIRIGSSIGASSRRR